MGNFATRPIIGPNTGKDLLALFLAELLGTFILLFFLCGNCTPFNTNTSYLHISLAAGFAVMTAIHTFGHVQGGHINPIVTIAAVICGHTDPRLMPIYFLGQFAGAFMGTGIIILLTPSEFTKGLCSPVVSPSIKLWQAVLMEYIMTAVLAIACCAIWDRKHANKHDSVSLRLGLVVTVMALTGIPYTGCHMNPARSFAPAVINNEWKDHWVYWVGPLSGTVMISYLYRYLFQTPEEEDEFE